jgi:hypothetical protein
MGKFKKTQPKDKKEKQKNNREKSRKKITIFCLTQIHEFAILINSPL